MQNINEIQAPSVIESPLGMRELTEVLIKHYGLHEGIYNLMVENQIGTGAFGPNPENSFPSTVVMLSKIGLVSALVENPTSVDAAIVNPQKSKKAPRKKEE